MPEFEPQKRISRLSQDRGTVMPTSTVVLAGMTVRSFPAQSGQSTA
jgi:hypothetical protein